MCAEPLQDIATCRVPGQLCLSDATSIARGQHVQVYEPSSQRDFPLDPMLLKAIAMPNRRGDRLPDTIAAFAQEATHCTLARPCGMKHAAATFASRAQRVTAPHACKHPMPANVVYPAPPSIVCPCHNERRTMYVEELLLDTFAKLSKHAPKGEAAHVPAADIFLSIEQRHADGEARVGFEMRVVALADATDRAGRVREEQLFHHYRVKQAVDNDEFLIGVVIEAEREVFVHPYTTRSKPFDCLCGPLRSSTGRELAADLASRSSAWTIKRLACDVAWNGFGGADTLTVKLVCETMVVSAAEPQAHIVSEGSSAPVFGEFPDLLNIAKQGRQDNIAAPPRDGSRPHDVAEDGDFLSRELAAVMEEHGEMEEERRDLHEFVRADAEATLPDAAGVGEGDLGIVGDEGAVEAKESWDGFLLRLGIASEVVQAGRRIDFARVVDGLPLGVVHYVKGEPLNQKATCKQHPYCVCWVQPRIPTTEQDILRDLARWLANDGGSHAAHLQAAFDTKVRFGMKPRAPK